ncbi:MAG: hypothetical protein HUJ42_02705 [Malacoplasma sp.]|nr:hypothetical protein [Malacoplasma sp.]
MKFNKKIFFSTLSLSVIAIGALGTIFGVKGVTNLNNSLLKKSVTNQDDVSTSLIAAEKNDQNANLSTTAGPLTFWGNTITALDWFGAKLWQIDMAQYNKDDKGNMPGTSYTGAWTRAWYNWDYNRKTNTLWVLGCYYETNKNQNLFKIDAATGSIQTIPLGDTKGRRFISALVSGNVMIYGTAAEDFSSQASAYLYNASTKKTTELKGDSNQYVPKQDTKATDNSAYDKSKYKWYFFNIIPVATNRNFVEIVSYSTTASLTGDQGAQYASYDIYFILVDDNLNFVKNSSSFWNKGAVKVASGMKDFRNTQITPQRDYYTMLDGNVVTIVYNTVIIINAQNGINISRFSMSESKWILSWSLDSNENLFFKFKDDSKIYEVTSDIMKGATNSNNSIAPITYLDLKSISKASSDKSTSSIDVSSYANNYIIFNVYGYSGSLMLINEFYNAKVSATNDADKSKTGTQASTSTNSRNYGLAIAVVQNSSNSNVGDYLGLLNTKESVITTPDFEINSSILSSKIPSEITRNDITTLNDSFFQDGTGYTPFEISNISDSEGKFTITANLYKIPWYTKTLPSDAVPKKITKQFTNANKISQKTSWITLNTANNYDFLNSLPSTITVADIEKLNPFVASFQSQVITDTSGKQLYPKTTYSIDKKEDSTGKITIKAVYNYVPMGVNYTDGKNSQVLSYSSTQEYQVFKKGDTSSFNYTGGTANNTNQTIDISKVGELKSYLQSGNLPSSIAASLNSGSADNSQYLQFINTDTSKGFPISKMKFSASGNDTNGTLSITASIVANVAPDNKSHSFVVNYQNLNKLNAYSFAFNDVSKIGTTSFADMLASTVTSGDVLSDLVKYAGFDSNNFNITLVPDDINGKLTVNVNLDKSYASSIGSSNHGFNKYVATKTFSGFLTTEQYNTRYAVEFKSDNDVTLLDLKQIQPVQIYNALGGTNKTSLKVGDKTYTSLNQLVKDLLVTKIGNAIPADWTSNNTKVTTAMYVDNNLGYVSFLVQIPQATMVGASSDLDLIVNYTGFVKGNIDNTSDNMSFISNTMLKNYLVSKNIFTAQQYSELTPSKFAEWANTKDNFKQLITFKSGEYETKLNSGDFKIAVVANDAQGTVSLTINYGQLKDSKSLSEYSIQYTI